MRLNFLFACEVFFLFLSTLLGYSDFLQLVALAFFFFLLLFTDHSVSKKNVLCFFSLLAIVAFYASLAFFVPDVFLQIERDQNLFLYKIIGYLSFVFSMFFIWVYYKDKAIRLHQVILYILVFHLAFFYIQVLSFYAFGFTIDYMGLVTEENQRVFYMGQFRPSGVFVEPSTYAFFVLSLLISKLFLNFEGKLITGMTLFSIAITFSTAAFLSLLVFCFFYFYTIWKCSKNKLAIFVFMLFFSPFLVAAGSFQVERYADDGIASSGSVGMRMKLVENILDRNILTIKFWVGNGLFSYDQEVYDQQKTEERVAAVDDGTVAISLLFRFGMLGVVIFFAMLTFFKGWKARGLILSLFMTKVIFFDMVFWLPFVAYATWKKGKKTGVGDL